jgi:hypothetical protein
MRNDVLISHGTGFLACRLFPTKRCLLFTARHNLTGEDHFTKKPLHSSGPVIATKVRLHIPNRENLQWKIVDKEIFNDDTQERLWIEHPKLGAAVDVAAIEITKDDLEDGAFGFIHLNDAAPAPGRHFGVGRVVHIIGFPITMTTEFHGIWTTGFVATDPRIDFQLPIFGKLPCFLVNCRTWKGQSGSPVVNFDDIYGFKTDGGWMTPSGGGTYMPHMYTGRLNPKSSSNPGESSSNNISESSDTARLNPKSSSNPGESSPNNISESSDIGIVWKSALLQEILYADTSPA